jgi:protein required for attachment to host cells
VSSDHSAKDDSAERFAQLICSELETARTQGSFEKLYIVAAPSFLGLLRKHQPAPLRQLVGAEVAKNLTTQSPESIREHLPDFL